MDARRRTREEHEIGRLIDTAFRSDPRISRQALSRLGSLLRSDDQYNDNLIEGILHKARSYLLSMTGRDLDIPRVCGSHGNESEFLIVPNTIATYDRASDEIILHCDPMAISFEFFVNTLFHEYFHYAHDKSYSVGKALEKVPFSQVAYEEGTAEFFAQSYSTAGIRSRLERASCIYSMMSGDEMEHSAMVAMALNKAEDRRSFAKILLRVERSITIDNPVHAVSGPAIAMLLHIKNNFQIGQTIREMLEPPFNLFKTITEMPKDNVRDAIGRIVGMVRMAEGGQ
jgi:hypothetical protein